MVQFLQTAKIFASQNDAIVFIATIVNNNDVIGIREYISEPGCHVVQIISDIGSITENTVPEDSKIINLFEDEIEKLQIERVRIGYKLGSGRNASQLEEETTLMMNDVVERYGINSLLISFIAICERKSDNADHPDVSRKWSKIARTIENMDTHGL